MSSDMFDLYALVCSASLEVVDSIDKFSDWIDILWSSLFSVYRSRSGLGLQLKENFTAAHSASCVAT